MNSKCRQLKYMVLIGVALFVGLVGGCTLDSINQNVNTTVSTNNLREASNILGNSLSDDNSGVMLSVRDALSIASEEGFTSIAGARSGSNSTAQSDRSGRGSERNYTHRFESSQGRHVITFRRVVNLSLFSKEVNDTLAFVYRDSDGSSIRFPANNSARINSIFFTGKRSGKIQEGNRTTNFTRQDTFSVEQLSGSTSYITIDGVHTEDGITRVRRSDGSTSVYDYHLEINFLNVEIPKSALATNNLYRDLTGTLSWRMRIQKQSGSASDTKTLQGTIILNGDGTGRLLFQQAPDRLQVNLNDGEVREQDQSFEGELARVNVQQRKVELVSGRVLHLTDSTDLEGDDGLKTLDNVRSARQSGADVWAEGEGFTQGDRFYILEIEFERLEEDDEEREIDFEDPVTAVDTEQQLFTLNDSLTVQVNSQTEVDDSGDYVSLSEVEQALQNGQPVMADGEAVELSSSASSDLRAIEVRFEQEASDDEDSDSDGDSDSNSD